MRDTPPSVSGVDHDGAAVSGRARGAGRGAGDQGGRAVRRLTAGGAPVGRSVSHGGPGGAGRLLASPAWASGTGHGQPGSAWPGRAAKIPTAPALGVAAHHTVRTTSWEQPTCRPISR